jgi:hypothetical protein
MTIQPYNFLKNYKIRSRLSISKNTPMLPSPGGRELRGGRKTHFHPHPHPPPSRGREFREIISYQRSKGEMIPMTIFRMITVR